MSYLHKRKIKDSYNSYIHRALGIQTTHTHMKRRGREYEYNDKQGLLLNFGLKISALRWKGAKNAEKERIDNIHSGKLDRQVVGARRLFICIEMKNWSECCCAETRLTSIFSCILETAAIIVFPVISRLTIKITNNIVIARYLPLPDDWYGQFYLYLVK